MLDTRKPGSTHRTATGGLVTYHPWGLVHKAGHNYTGSADSSNKEEDEFDGKGLTNSK